MKFLVLGCGSIGKRHLRNLLSIGIKPENIFAVDPREDRIEEIKNLGIGNFSKDYNNIIQEDKIDAALICSPTNLHIKQGIDLAKKNIHLFIEKPLDGEILIFNQCLPHGNIVNQSNETRWTFNCRFKGLFTPYNDKKIAEFFQPITMKPVSQIGLDYKLPKLK